MRRSPKISAKRLTPHRSAKSAARRAVVPLLAARAVATISASHVMPRVRDGLVLRLVAGKKNVRAKSSSHALGGR